MSDTATRNTVKRAKMAAILAAMARFGHPSMAITWHAPAWVGRVRPRRPQLLARVVKVQPARRRSRSGWNA